MTVQRFDRHADMSMDTLREVSNIISSLPIDFGDLNNKLYGLYDGYYYSDLLFIAKKQTTADIYARIESVVAKVKEYPTLTKAELL